MKALYIPLHITEGERIVLDCEKYILRIPELSVCKICLYWIDCKVRKPEKFRQR